MPWLIGIDEAGYGPNLGPLVMTSVACRVSKERRADLWKELAEAVRRHEDADDGRLLIADSKLVYSPSRGLADLEKSVLGAMTGARSASKGDSQITHYLDWACPASHEELGGEPWFTGKTVLPTQASLDDCHAAGERFERACTDASVGPWLVRSVVVCPARFNSLVDRWGSKASVLGLGLTELLRCHHNPDDGDDGVAFVIDKHGGRNYYSAMLQHAFDEGVVLARKEGALSSVYQVVGLRRPTRITIEPRADAGHFCVALASMLSKYLRELLMLEFNRFWQSHVPGLKATAGYPGDAERFYTAIQPAANKLGIEENALWRRK